jgi:cytidine deaminase
MGVKDIPWERLFAEAFQARERAYAPYSNFRVGAAGLFEQGGVVAGCNVENASYGLAVCAERNAIGRAVVEGQGQLVAIAVVGDSKVPVPPCGMCRQVLAEFAPATAEIRCRNLQGEERRYTVAELLPHMFNKEFL